MNLLLAIPASDINPKTTQETPPPGKDPLIAYRLQKEQYIGITALAIALVVAVGFISRRVEYAILFAVVLSAILITFFLLL